MIVVQSIFHLASNSKRDALKLMRNMVRLCRLEHGCISYEYFEGISNPNQIILIQEWKNSDCLQQHYQTDHMEHFQGTCPSPSRPFISHQQAIQKQRLPARRPIVHPPANSILSADAITE